MKELERFNWWLICNVILNSVDNLRILVLRLNLWASTVNAQQAESHTLLYDDFELWG